MTPHMEGEGKGRGMCRQGAHSKRLCIPTFTCKCTCKGGWALTAVKKEGAGRGLSLLLKHHKGYM